MATHHTASNAGRRPRRFGLPALLALTLAVVVTVARWPESPRGKAGEAASRLARALAAGEPVGSMVQLPAFLGSRTATEQSHLLGEALAGEISREGLDALRARGEFGSLRVLFPAEATAWAAAFGVNPDDCVAFKMQRDGLRAELVLLRQHEDFVVLRCNNVKQMAAASLP